MLPEECAGLSSRRFYLQRLKLAATKTAFGLQFGLRQRRIGVYLV